MFSCKFCEVFSKTPQTHAKISTHAFLFDPRQSFMDPRHPQQNFMDPRQPRHPRQNLIHAIHEST